MLGFKLAPVYRRPNGCPNIHGVWILISYSTPDFLVKVLWVVENIEKFSSSLSGRRLTLALQPDSSEADCIGTEWVEITRQPVEVLEGAGPWHQVRLIVSSLQTYQIQVIQACCLCCETRSNCLCQWSPFAWTFGRIATKFWNECLSWDSRLQWEV